MKTKKNSLSAGVAALLLAALPGMGIKNAAAEQQVNITATIKAVCDISVDPLIALGDIPATAFNDKSANEEISGYDKTFAIKTSCAGANKYSLTLTPAKTSNGCLAASSEELAFCLYSGSAKINLAAAGTTLERETTVTSETIKVVPARGSKAPTAGDYSGSMTVTIAPL